MVFKWDPSKAAGNRTKLEDTLSTTFPDLDHSSIERRFVTAGMSGSGCLLVIVHAEQRHTSDAP